MKFTVITLFPDLVEQALGHGLLAQAQTRGLLQIQTINPRQFTSDVHQTVDDRVFGGGDGMVMKVEPLASAIKKVREEGPVHVAVLSPQGRVWNQRHAATMAESRAHVVLVCGRYGGIDHRFTVRYADEEISLGDFILNGGELAACAVIESVARLVPGVLGNKASAQKDSFSDGWLEGPQFTRPREVEGLPVPKVLTQGHHGEVELFEKAVSELKTFELRPDMLPDSFHLERSLQVVERLADIELESLGWSRAGLQALRERRKS